MSGPRALKAEKAKILTEMLPHILKGHLETLGVETPRAAQFANQLTETLRLTDTMQLNDAFKYLEQQTISTAAKLARVPQPALDAMAQLTSAPMESLQQIAPSVPGVPQPPIPGVPPPPAPVPPVPGVPLPPPPSIPPPSIPTPPVPGVPILPVPRLPQPAPPGAASLLTITSQISQTNQIARQVSGARQVAKDLKTATDGLRDGAKKTNDFVKQGLHDQAKSAFDGASKDAKGIIDGLFHLSPLSGSPEAHKANPVTETRYKTSTKTHSKEITRTYDVEKTKIKYVTVTVTSSTTKTETTKTTATLLTFQTRTTTTTTATTKTFSTTTTTLTTSTSCTILPGTSCQCTLGNCSIVGPAQPSGAHCACSLGSCSIVGSVESQPMYTLKPAVPGVTRLVGTRVASPTL
jgi:hypothetical protein